ncbi:MAG: antirestriction protein ArdA [Candidatus Aenigmatarchaeota archaeon]|nr:MAG: antirestriction protein ArdA [Candidatus Aenigmarchaeota archaeon]
MVKVYLTNLAQYNAGRLVGKWLDLPLDEKELKQTFREVLGSDEEFFITDWESPFRIEEYDNVWELNRFAEQLEALDEHDQERVIYLIESVGYKREEALERYEDVIFYKDMTIEDVAEELVEEGCFGNIADNIKCYLDYERIARDLSIDGYSYEQGKGTFFSCV